MSTPDAKRLLAARKQMFAQSPKNRVRMKLLTELRGALLPFSSAFEYQVPFAPCHLLREQLRRLSARVRCTMAWGTRCRWR